MFGKFCGTHVEKILVRNVKKYETKDAVEGAEETPEPASVPVKRQSEKPEIKSKKSKRAKKAKN